MIKRCIETTLNVRPIMVGLVHEEYYEGPCRFGGGEGLQVGYDALALREMFKEFVSDVKKNVIPEVNVMEPIYVERTDSWFSKEEMFEKMAEDIEKVDFYIFHSFIGRNDIVIEFAQRYNKPFALEPRICCEVAAISAATRARGLECYCELSWDRLRTVLKAQLVKKALKNANVLLIPRMNSTVSMSSVDTFISLDQVTQKFGIKFRYKNFHELIDQLSPAVPGGNPTTPGRKTPDLTEEDVKKVKELADELEKGAEYVDVSREYLEKQLTATITVLKNLDLYDCNAFTIPCPDACSSRRLNEEKITFCMTHSLLNEQGIPSACEYDINALISKMILQTISKSGSYMGNVVAMDYLENGKADIDQFGGFSWVNDEEMPEDQRNLVISEHSVPNRKMHGFDKEIGRYALNHFAVDQGFGAVMRYDFNMDKGTPLTLARFSPDIKKMFIARGEVVAGGGYRDNNCATAVIFRVADTETFRRGQLIAGNHVPLAYGDHVKELVEFCEEMGIEPVLA
ncbi:MAG: fucose isomerase [Christensenellaceae bacterium]|nr:fucose isomerase [Christensenellaceae bacterium]